MKPLKFFSLLILLALAPGAQAHQDPAPIRQVVEEFLRVQTRGLPGTVQFEVGAIDPTNHLAPCPAPEAFLLAGSRPWGRINVGVRCPVEGGWSIYVPARVRVLGEYLVTTRPLARGQTLTAADLVRREGDLAELPAGILSDESQAIGMRLNISVQSGQILRSDSLRPPRVIRQGQRVPIVSAGPGFTVASEGKALNDAAAGQPVQVRLPSGQTLSGIARADGSVEVRH